MMIVHLENLILVPKPRGKLAPNGHIYHSTAMYKDFTKAVIKAVQEAKGFYPHAQLKTDVTIGLFIGYRPYKIGHEPDIDNLLGAIVDCLVKSYYLKDDNRKIWDGCYMRAFPQATNNTIVWLGTQSEEDAIIKAVRQEILKSQLQQKIDRSRTI